MYCLLENNYIVEKEPFYNCKDNYYFISEYNYETGKIEDLKVLKYSEDIIDLIAEGDMVELYHKIHGFSFLFPIVGMEDLDYVITNSSNKIISVYKKKNKDYICVWECDSND